MTVTSFSLGTLAQSNGHCYGGTVANADYDMKADSDTEAETDDTSCDDTVSLVDTDTDADADANDGSGDDNVAAADANADADSNSVADADADADADTDADAYADLATVTDLGLITSTLIGESWHPVWKTDGVNTSRTKELVLDATTAFLDYKIVTDSLTHSQIENLHFFTSLKDKPQIYFRVQA